MNIKLPKFIGGRIVKTGIAVFLTAWICQLFNWPVIFAVITAIVTIEPTASASIKKGIIRFPASALGAAYSMVLTAFLGDMPITYTLSAVLTIISCHKLKLDAGILVATLTAVNMIPTTHDHFFINFLIRLGTTTVGLSVSTLVNLLILPPNYSVTINKNMKSLFEKSGSLLELRFKEILNEKGNNKETLRLFEEITKELDKTEQLCQYQKEEWRYHRHSKKDMRLFHYEHKKLIVLRQILYHIGNLMYLPFEKVKWEEKEKQRVSSSVKSLSGILKSHNYKIADHHYPLIRGLLEEFWDLRQDIQEHLPLKYHHHFSPETIILFEILSIHDLVEELQRIHQFEWKEGDPLSIPIQLREK